MTVKPLTVQTSDSNLTLGAVRDPLPTSYGCVVQGQISLVICRNTIFEHIFYLPPSRNPDFKRLTLLKVKYDQSYTPDKWVDFYLC